MFVSIIKYSRKCFYCLIKCHKIIHIKTVCLLSLREEIKDRKTTQCQSKLCAVNPFTSANRFCGLHVMSSEIEITENRFTRFSCRLVC